MLGWIRRNLFGKTQDKSTLNEKDVKYLEYLVNNFLRSKKRLDMLTGERYYKGIHDILFRKREIIGEGGKLQEVDNLPNNRRIDNQYGKLVDQKVNYLVGKPVTFYSDNEQYQKYLSEIFDLKFQKVLKNMAEDTLNNGIAWLYPFYDEEGNFRFKKFESSEILPIWRDEAHTKLDFVIRCYVVQKWTGSVLENEERVDVYSVAGIDRYCYSWGSLKYTGHENYMNIGAEGYNWDKLPFIPFKYNMLENPLINRVKTLQDGINKIISTFENNLDEDARNTILVLKNYDGENLGKFRRNLSTYGVVKVSNDGGVDKLTVEINSENYTSILKIYKDALIENGRGFNAKDDRLGNNPNQMNIQSMYSDIDLDATGMETEFRAGFEQLLWFVNTHLFNSGLGNFENEKVDIIFNKDIVVNESQSIENCAKSVGIISDETIISMHPWVKDPKKELEKIKAQKEQELQDYQGAFVKKGPGGVDEE